MENTTKLINREFKIDSKSMSEDFILDFSVASDLPIKMSFGTEVLVIGEENIKLERLKSAGNIVFSHDKEEILGKVLDAYIADGVLRVKARFSEHSEHFGMIKDGTLTGVSVGYLVHKYENKDGILYAMEWEPIEVSLVAIPADITVGIGRSLDTNEIKVTPTTVNTVEENKPIIKITKEEKTTMENTINYRSIGSQYGLTESDIAFCERSQLSEVQFQNLLIEKLQNKAVSTRQADVELNDKEVEQYSLARAILAFDPKSGVKAGFESEVSEQIARTLGKSTNGLFIPQQVLERDMSAGGTNLGKDFVQSINPGMFVNYAFNTTLANKLGVNFITGLRENLQIPKITGATTFAWYSENGEIVQADPATGQITLAPKRGGASFNYSNMLLKQSNPSIEAYLVGHIRDSVAVGIDNAVFNGTGLLGQPSGILTSVTTNTVTGTSFSHAKSLDFPAKIATANRLSGKLAYVTNPTVGALLKSREKSSGYPSYLITDDNKMAGYNVFESNQIGSGTLLFGDFGMVVVGQWGGIELIINPYTNAKKGLVEITAQAMLDVAILDEKAFCKSTNVA